MAGTITLRDIARHLNMPRATVAAALNPRLAPRLRPEVRQRVADAARQLGYVPHLAARRLASTRPDSHQVAFDQIAVIYQIPVDTELDPMFMIMINGAERELSRSNTSITLVRLTEDRDWARVVHMARAGGVDGWMLYGGVTDAVAARLDSIGLPFVVLGEHYCSRPLPTVDFDHALAARLAIQHLASLGHRRIAFLGGGLRFTYQRITLDAFRATVASLGLDQDPHLIVASADWITSSSDGATTFAHWWRDIDAKPTALYTPEFAADEAVRGFLRHLRVPVPGQVSVIGAAFTASALAQNRTQIIMPTRQVGHQAAVLLRRLATASRVPPPDPPHTPTVAPILIPPTLHQGWTTVAPIRTPTSRNRAPRR